MTARSSIDTFLRLGAFCALASVLAFGCAQPSEDAGGDAASSSGAGKADGGPAADRAGDAMAGKTPMRAEARIEPTQGNEVRGTVTFEAVEGGVHVVVHLEGLTPGEHGFHVHEKGDCSAPDGTSAGGHFAPDGSPHGAPDMPAGKRHVGDLGNVEADASGVATADFVDPILALSGPHSVVGRGVIVHAGADDLTSQPTGAAGARVACGVIRAAGSGGDGGSPADGH